MKTPLTSERCQRVLSFWQRWKQKESIPVAALTEASGTGTGPIPASAGQAHCSWDATVSNCSKITVIYCGKIHCTAPTSSALVDLGAGGAWVKTEASQHEELLGWAESPWAASTGSTKTSWCVGKHLSSPRCSQLPKSSPACRAGPPRTPREGAAAPPPVDYALAP